MTLAQIDGSMNKTDKSKLMHNLENRYTETRPPPPGHVYMQDALFLLQALVNCPETFGAIAKVILMRLCKVTSSEIHFVCDTYPTGSIKDIERACRAKGEVSDLRVIGFWLKFVYVQAIWACTYLLPFGLVHFGPFGLVHICCHLGLYSLGHLGLYIFVAIWAIARPANNYYYVILY